MPIIEPILREIASDSSWSRRAFVPIAQAPDYRRQCANCERFSAAMSRLLRKCAALPAKQHWLAPAVPSLPKPGLPAHARAPPECGAVGDAALAARAAAAAGARNRKSRKRHWPLQIDARIVGRRRGSLRNSSSVASAAFALPLSVLRGCKAQAVIHAIGKESIESAINIGGLVPRADVS